MSLFRNLGWGSRASTPEIWRGTDDEARATLDKRCRSGGANVCEVDFRSTSIGRWDHDISVKAMIATSIPKTRRCTDGGEAPLRFILYFPLHKNVYKRILRIHGYRRCNTLQLDIHQRLCGSEEGACKMMIMLVDQDVLYRCVNHGNHIEVRWSPVITTVLGRGNSPTVHPASLIVSEQDGASSSLKMFALVAQIPVVTHGAMMMVKPEIKWPVGQRMAANTRPAPPPERGITLETAGAARHSVQSTQGRSKPTASTTATLFDSDSGDAEEDYGDLLRSGDPSFDAEEVEIDDGVGLLRLPTSFNKGVASGSMGVVAAPYVDGVRKDRAAIAYDPGDHVNVVTEENRGADWESVALFGSSSEK